MKYRIMKSNGVFLTQVRENHFLNFFVVFDWEWITFGAEHTTIESARADIKRQQEYFEPYELVEEIE